MMKLHHKDNRRRQVPWGVMLLGVLALAGPAAAGCTNHTAEENKGAVASATPPAASSANLAPRALATSNTVRREALGCILTTPTACPKDQVCPTPPSFEVDCPQNLLRPGEPAPVARRPSGKESWVRVKPWIYYDAAKSSCAYKGEWFCSPQGAFGQCTPQPPAGTVVCTKKDGAFDLQSFVYTDGSGVCHKVAAMTCTTNRRGLCELPEGEVVPCPK